MANGWRVDSQRYTERYMPNGQFQDVVEVQVQADDGTFATIVVPTAQYTPENVTALADDWLARHLAVRNL
jgi:hypothetical protein